MLETKEPKVNMTFERVLLDEPPKSNPMGAATRKKIELETVPLHIPRRLKNKYFCMMTHLAAVCDTEAPRSMGDPL